MTKRRVDTTSPLVPVVVLALLLGACSVDSTYLPGLLADPMAEYVPPGAELASSTHQKEGTGLLGKPIHAQVVRTFRIDEKEASRILESTVDEASASGWDVSQSSLKETLYSGTKDLSAGEGEIWIALQTRDPDPDEEGPLNQISITLEYLVGAP